MTALLGKRKNGTVNYEVLESLIEEQIAARTDCIVAMGTTGESATTSEEEHIQVIRFVCEVVNGRIPVVAGTGSNCTQTAVELSVEAEEAGADGVSSFPYYNKATQNGLKAHYKDRQLHQNPGDPLNATEPYRREYRTGDHR